MCTFAEGKIEIFADVCMALYPQFLFQDLHGKVVLCLASGGARSRQCLACSAPG